jgi:small-conductance mechanosensitive channel
LALGVCAALAAVIAGCKDEDQERVVEEGRKAIAGAESVLGDALGSLMKEAQELDWHSSEQALSAARDKALDLEKRLANIKAPSNLDAIRLEEVKAEVARLQAACTVQNLQRQWDAAAEKAAEGKHLAQEKAGEAGNALREADRDFRDLDDKLNAAKKAYGEASDKVAELVTKVKGESK